ncbi:AMP-binding enzyme [Archaeoglobus sp.]
MHGYWKRDPAEGFIEIEGKKYVKTGDLGYLDDEGYIYVVDRIKEIIKYKGYTIAPFEIEAALMKHDAVTDVAVIGVPDEVVCEIPKAFVAIKEEYRGKITEEDILNWIKDKIADYKRPRVIEFVDSIPRTASGKVLRRVLRDREIEKSKG